MAVACVDVAPRELRPCPCTAGYLCCARLARCVRVDDAPRLSCDASDTVDAGAGLGGGAGGIDADVGDTGAAEILPAACSNGGGGVSAAYYRDLAFAGTPVRRLERGLFLRWDEGSPDPSIPTDNFSALFAADLQPDVTGLHTLFAGSDDDVRLWLDGELLIDAWRGPNWSAYGATVALEAGRRYPLLVEFAEKVGAGVLEITWKPPGKARTAIPQCALIPTAIVHPHCTTTDAGDCIPTGVPACNGGGSGLRASYYADANFTAPAFTRVDGGPSFTWQWSTPDPALVGPFSVRWEGLLKAPFAESYTFFLVADGSAELRIAGQAARAFTADGVSQEATVTLALGAGEQVAIAIDYRQPAEGAYSFVQLRWKSPSIPKSGIPRCRFWP